MIHLKTRQFAHNPIYYIMSEQPNCCPKCQARLEIIGTIQIKSEEIQVNYCDECKREILMIEDDVEL